MRKLLIFLVFGIAVTLGSCGKSGFQTARTGGTAPAGGAVGTGGFSGAGGMVVFGGASGAPIDAPLDQQVSSGPEVLPKDSLTTPDTGGSSCEQPLPLRCGDRLAHSTLVQGRPNSWSGYGCTARYMSGREVIYAFSSPTTCRVTAYFSTSTSDLFLHQLSRCDPWSCTALPELPQTFTIDPGQTKLLAVDGYAGAAGGYTLAADCDCAPDAGARDAPTTPPSDTPIAPICDPKLAAPALSALGLLATSESRPQTTTLPAVLATDANWGLKSTVCQAAGYDLAPLAGKPVCNVGQDIAEQCQGFPSLAWVVLNNGAVACVYKTVHPDFGPPPGVYAANDPICTKAAIAPGATVDCQGRSCTNATGPCGPVSKGMSRTAGCGYAYAVAMTCDDPTDCPSGTVCCSLEASAGLAGTACVKPDECLSPSRLICRLLTDCPAPQKCGVPNPMPAEISTNPSVKPSTWVVSYQVCAM